MDEPRAIRVYKGPDNPAPFMATINSLSFHCRNMAANIPGTIQSLTRIVPGGRISVMRVGPMGNELYGYEFVTTHAIAELMQIILSSANGETYGINYRASNESVAIEDVVSKITLPAVYLDKTFIDPNYDMYSEVCPFIYTLNHKSFIVVVGDVNYFQTVSKPRDDWHNNNYSNDPTLSVGQSFLTYNDLCTRMYLSPVKIGYSFSPFTATIGLSHIDRHIDQSKRLYIPILGRGEGIDYHLLNCEGYPYGKKPFTISDSGISTYREVVKVLSTLSSPDIQRFNLQLLWPFAPYLHEISTLNLQFLSGFPALASLQDFGSFCVYVITWDTDEVTSHNYPLRSDSIEASLPDVSSSTISNNSSGYTTGTWETKVNQSQISTCNLQKSATIGTIGNLNDVHIDTILNTTLTYLYSSNSLVDRITNFPDIYYLAEFVDDNSWNCGAHSDVTNSQSSLNSQWNTVISGSQTLKAGDVVIDSGSILMEYTGIDISFITHNGTATQNKPCNPPASIGYTSQQMSVNEQQSFVCLDADGVETPCTDCTWEVTSGGGSITQEGVYTAPASNPECANNPVISLICGGITIDTVAIAVTAVSNHTQEAYRHATCSDCHVIGGSCYTDGPCYFYYCDGTLARSSVCSGSIVAMPCTDCTANCINTWTVVNPEDTRTGAMKTAGCCPYQLL